MAMESESHFQEIYLLIFLFALVANRSIFAWPNCFIMKENASFESIHSVVSLNCLDFLSASIFFCPGKWAAEIQTPCILAHSLTCFALLWHVIDLEQPILFT